MAVSDGARVRMHKEPGLVSNVFTPTTLAPLVGYHAIGHTRYSTTGGSTDRNIQPFLVETHARPAGPRPQRQHRQHAEPARRAAGARLRADRHERLRGDDPDARRRRRAVRGRTASSARCRRGRAPTRWCCWRRDRVLAVRDPWGFRPLSVGRLPNGGHAVASETCALSTLGCVDICEVAAGRDRHAAGRRAAPPPGARAGAAPGALHVRVRVLLPARLACGTAATCTHVRERSARSWPTSRPSTPTS